MYFPAPQAVFAAGTTDARVCKAPARQGRVYAPDRGRRLLFRCGARHEPALLKNHSARGYIRVVADGKGAEHLCARADEDIVADSRVTFARVFAGAAERHALIYHNIVADNGGLADNDAGAVVDKKSSAYGCGRVYLYPRFARRPLRYPSGEEKQLMAVAPIGFAVHPYGLEAGIEEKNFEHTPCGGVAPLEGAYILFEPVKHKYQLLGLG